MSAKRDKEKNQLIEFLQAEIFSAASPLFKPMLVLTQSYILIRVRMECETETNLNELILFTFREVGIFSTKFFLWEIALW
jgi:hypothetical protein